LYLGGSFTKIFTDSIQYLTRYYSPDTIHIEPPAPVGIEKEKSAQQLELYPNPANSKLYIRSQLQFSKITIQDSMGKQMMILHSMPENGINISSLQKGVYILQATSKDNFTYREKFIVD
jgi:hypothetical protein